MLSRLVRWYTEHNILKPRVTLQPVFIRFPDFCRAKFTSCFNDVNDQSFVHLIHICWVLSVKHIIKRVSFDKNGRGKHQSWDINSLLEDRYTLNSGLFQAKTLYSFGYVLKIVLKITKSQHHLLHNFRARRCLSWRSFDQTWCFHGNPSSSIYLLTWWELFQLFSGHTPSVEVKINLCLKLSKLMGEMDFRSNERLLLFYWK